MKYIILFENFLEKYTNCEIIEIYFDTNGKTGYINIEFSDKSNDIECFIILNRGQIMFYNNLLDPIYLKFSRHIYNHIQDEKLKKKVADHFLF